MGRLFIIRLNTSPSIITNVPYEILCELCVNVQTAMWILAKLTIFLKFTHLARWRCRLSKERDWWKVCKKIRHAKAQMFSRTTRNSTEQKSESSNEGITYVNVQQFISVRVCDCWLFVHCKDESVFAANTISKKVHCDRIIILWRATWLLSMDTQSMYSPYMLQ